MKLEVIKQRNLWWAISATVILAGLVAMGISWSQLGAPLRPSLDFVGGTRLQLEFDCSKPEACQKLPSVEQVRNLLAEQKLEGSSIQIIEAQGDKRPALSIRTKTLDQAERETLQKTLTEKVGNFDPQSINSETVGPTLGKQLFASGLLALLVSFAGIIVYLAFRFQWDYAAFAIVALMHDVLVTCGVFAVLGLILGVEVDSLFIVALLTIVGFSVNDTVVIYDRVREVIADNPTRHINGIVDEAVNQTLGRSINTTLTTLLTLVSIFLFGGDTLKYFALALIVGFITGAYSSIFIASSLLALWREKTGKAIAQPDAVEAAIDA